MKGLPADKSAQNLSSLAKKLPSQEPHADAAFRCPQCDYCQANRLAAFR